MSSFSSSTSTSSPSSSSSSGSSSIETLLVGMLQTLPSVTHEMDSLISDSVRGNDLDATVDRLNPTKESSHGVGFY